MSESLHGDLIAVGDQYYILASTFTADLPKLVLKHDEAFFVADRRGDFPDVPDSEFGFYVGGTRFLDRFDLRLHGQRPLLLNSAVSGDNLQVAVDLTNADVHDGDTAILSIHHDLFLPRGPDHFVFSIPRCYKSKARTSSKSTSPPISSSSGGGRNRTYKPAHAPV